MSEAKIYGESLHTLAKEEKISGEILSEFTHLMQLFKEYPDYIKILDSPQLTHRELEKMLDEDFSGRLNRYMLNFLKLLSEKHMVHCINECFKEYERQYNKDNNIKTVFVTTAKPLSEANAEKLIKKLEERTGGKIILKKQVDESCIGGIIIKTDDMCIDSSVKGELERMRQSIIN